MTDGTLDRDRTIRVLADRLLAARAADGCWEGHLASSALSTGTAVLALHLTARAGRSFDPPLQPLITAGVGWLNANQNADGGWGDTARSRSNISTTAIVWATLSLVAPDSSGLGAATQWLRGAAGGVSPEALRSVILRRYGQDHTFSVPILTVLALTDKLGDSAWRSIPQLPFELAAFPHAWFQYLRLPVVSYALPALIAIGQVRHRWAPSRNPITCALRNRLRDVTYAVLREIQPDSGGYLEATPLTSFVVMSLSGAGRSESAVVTAGVKFLTGSIRQDGSWPIDTNLSTWVTTLSIGALANAGQVPVKDCHAMRAFLLQQQSVTEHPFTHAAAGAWAWTPLSGGVPDADDTSGALIALRALGDPDAVTIAAAAAGVKWLLGVQNRDGGVPTFCRGWGALPFDRSTPEITAHAIRGWSAWLPFVDDRLRAEVNVASLRALSYLERSQRADGSWIPLWFGNEHAPDEDNPVYGTAKVLRGLETPFIREHPTAHACAMRALQFLFDCQNDDGGWGGNRGVPSSVEETGVALCAIAQSQANVNDVDNRQRSNAIDAAVSWLMRAVETPPPASPIGLYFARLWYYEELYPLIFSLDGLAATR